MINLVIFGDPVAKGRARATRRGIIYTPAKTRAAENDVASQVREQYTGPPLEGPVCLSIAFYMPVAKSWSKADRAAAFAGSIAHTSKPDVDNMVKLFKDATNGILFLDDAQVVDLRAVKGYDAQPKTVVSLWSLEVPKA